MCYTSSVAIIVCYSLSCLFVTVGAEVTAGWFHDSLNKYSYVTANYQARGAE